LSQTDHSAVPMGKGGSLGLNCSSEGVSLAGVSLLRVTPTGLAPRPIHELGGLMRCAYDRGVDLMSLSAGLDVIAKALNGGDLGRAMVAAVHLRLPEPSWANATRMARSDEALAKFNLDELRDWLGRWTTGGAARPESPTRAKPVHERRPSGSNPRRSTGHGIAPTAVTVGVPMGSAALTPMQIGEGAAVGEEVAGGGPLDPFADLAALGTLGVAAVVTQLKPQGSQPTTASSGNSGRSRAKPVNRYDEECQDIYDRDVINCKIVASIKSRSQAAACNKAAMVRYSECLRFGPGGIKTPFYWGN